MKKYSIIVILMIILLFVGCNKQETEVFTEWFGETRNISYGEQGILIGQNKLSFFDVATGSGGLICSDSACKHGKDCSAYFSNVLQMKAAIDGNKLLLVTDYLSDKLGDLYLYEASLDGSNRKKLAFLGNMQNGFQFMFLENYIVFDFWNNYDEDMVPLEKEIAGVYVYNKVSKEGRMVWKIEGMNARIPGMACWNDDIYFFSFYIDGILDDTLKEEEKWDYMTNHQKNQLCKLSLHDGTVEVIDDNAGNFYGMACMEGKVFCNYDYKLYMYDVYTEECVLFSAEDFRPQKCMLGDKVIFWKDSEYFVYSEKEGMQKLGSLENCSLLSVFPDVIYALNYATEDGNGELVYWRTEDFMAGDLNAMQRFKE